MNLQNEKISPLQVITLLYPTVTASGILMKLALTAQLAGREMWLAPIIAMILGIIAIFTAIKLNEAFPKESIIQYSQHIIGKIPGKILGLVFIYVLIHINGANISEYANFVTGHFMLRTPSIVVVTSMVFVCSLAIRSGIEVLARASEFFFPLLIITILMMFLLLIPELDGMNIFPLFEYGVMPPIKAVFSIQSWYSELFLLAFLLPSLQNREKKWKYSFIVLFIVALQLFLANLATLLTFDLLSKQLTYPLITAIRYIRIFDFIENIDAIVMAVWVGAAFLKISLYFYGIVVGTAQLFRLSSYRELTFPVGLILTVFGIWIADGYTELEYALGERFPYFLPFIFFIVLPSILYLIHFIKSKFMNDKKNKQAAEM